ncbi:rubrerythrin family protein, partial [bacterium]|nr:rubrerythrin family protein [bacterium]
MQKTIKNLAEAFVGESQARNRYTFYAKVAKKEGYEQLSEIFLLTAENEREHAKWLMRLINELKEKDSSEQEDIVVEAGVPIVFGDSKENLKA